jgi:hypothetical protein
MLLKSLAKVVGLTLAAMILSTSALAVTAPKKSENGQTEAVVSSAVSRAQNEVQIRRLKQLAVTKTSSESDIARAAEKLRQLQEQRSR